VSGVSFYQYNSCRHEKSPAPLREVPGLFLIPDPGSPAGSTGYIDRYQHGGAQGNARAHFRRLNDLFAPSPVGRTRPL
jgi:hypothetical protein